MTISEMMEVCYRAVCLGGEPDSLTLDTMDRLNRLGFLQSMLFTRRWPHLWMGPSVVPLDPWEYEVIRQQDPCMITPEGMQWVLRSVHHRSPRALLERLDEPVLLVCNDCSYRWGEYWCGVSFTLACPHCGTRNFHILPQNVVTPLEETSLEEEFFARTC